MIEIERDSALRGMVLSDEKPVAATPDAKVLFNSILIPDRVMDFLERYLAKVSSGKERRCWPHFKENEGET